MCYNNSNSVKHSWLRNYFLSNMKRITLTSSLLVISIICLLILAIGGDNCDACYSASMMAARFLVCGLVVMIGTIYFKEEFLKAEKIIFDVEAEPLRETDEAVDGVPFAGEGAVEAMEGKTLKSPYSQKDCVYFHSIKEQYVKRGKSSSWQVVENLAVFVPFYLKDEKGRLEIDLSNIDYDFSKYHIPLLHEKAHYPANSEVDCWPVLLKSGYNEGGQGFWGSLGATRYRQTEYVLAPGVKIFAYGMVEKSGNDLVLHEHNQYPLIISQKKREQYVRDFYRGDKLVYLANFLIAFGFSVFVLALNYFLKMPPDQVLAILALGNIIILGSITLTIYNRVVTLKQRALNALSNIDIDLKRRSDLIPNLVEAVKGYTAYEKELQQIVVESRMGLVFSKQPTANSDAVLPVLVAVIEKYPELKAVANFQALMEVLIDTEGRIAHAREFYNRSARKFNNLIGQFPFVMATPLLGFKELEFLSLSRGNL